MPGGQVAAHVNTGALPAHDSVWHGDRHVGCHQQRNTRILGPPRRRVHTVVVSIRGADRRRIVCRSLRRPLGAAFGALRAQRGLLDGRSRGGLGRLCPNFPRRAVRHVRVPRHGLSVCGGADPRDHSELPARQSRAAHQRLGHGNRQHARALLGLRRKPRPCRGPLDCRRPLRGGDLADLLVAMAASEHPGRARRRHGLALCVLPRVVCVSACVCVRPRMYVICTWYRSCCTGTASSRRFFCSASAGRARLIKWPGRS